MSAATGRGEGQTSVEKPSIGLFLALFCINFLATVPFWPLYFGMEDEAVTVLGASRILGGEWPYYHWDSRHTPGSYLLAALYFGVVGTDQWAVRSLMSLVAAGSGLLIFAIGRRTLPPRAAWFPWIAWCCGGLTAFPILNYHWIGTFFSLAGFYWALRWREELRAAVPLGLSLALALWTLQSDGLAVALMVGLIGLRYRPPGATRVLGAAGLASLLLWLPFLPVVSEVIRQNLLDLGQHLPFNRRPYDWQPWLNLGRAGLSPGLSGLQRWVMLSNFWLQAETYGLYYLTLAVSLVVFERSGQRPRAALAWCALGWALASGNRQTVAYLSFSCGGAFLCQAGLLTLLPRWPVWAGIWAAVEILGHGGRTLYLQQSWTHTIVTRVGVYRSGQAEQAKAMEVVRTWVDRYLPPGTEVLAYPYFCSLYTTEKLRNPLRVPVLTPFLYSQAEVIKARQQLESARTPWILYLELSPEFMQASYGISAQKYSRQAEQELQLLTQGYRLWEGGGSLRLYRRDS